MENHRVSFDILGIIDKSYYCWQPISENRWMLEYNEIYVILTVLEYTQCLSIQLTNMLPGAGPIEFKNTLNQEYTSYYIDHVLRAIGLDNELERLYEKYINCFH